MSSTRPAYDIMADADVITAVHQLSAAERRHTVDLLRALMEFDQRRLYLGEGHASLFAYCTQVLHYAEHAALNRIEVARAARRFPRLLDAIASGRLNLTGCRLLAPHLTAANVDELLKAACHKSKREIEEMIVALRPKPVGSPFVRRLAPSRTPRLGCAPPLAPDVSTVVPAPVAAPPPPVRPAIAPVSPERYKVQLTITRETRQRLREVQDLMRHSNPSGDLEKIFERAIESLLEDLQRQRFAASSRARTGMPADPHGRYIPATVRRAVWRRDEGRCAFVGARGRCPEAGFLEFHHIEPFAVGGAATVENIALRCRAHNAYESTLFFERPEADGVRERSAHWEAP
jgi:hypothetical protein